MTTPGSSLSDLPRLKPAPLIGSAVAILAGGIQRWLPIWLALVVFESLLSAVLRTLHVQREAYFTSLAFETSLYLGQALGNGLAVRTLIAPDRPVWRPDRGLAAYTLLSTLAGLAANPYQFSRLLGFKGVGVTFGGALLYVIGALALIKISLWFTSLLLGEGRITPARSWRLMRGGVWAYVVALFPMAILPTVVATWFWAQYFRHGGFGNLIVCEVFSAMAAVGTSAIAATVYRARLVDPLQTADVFD